MSKSKFILSLLSTTLSFAYAETTGGETLPHSSAKTDKQENDTTIELKKTEDAKEDKAAEKSHAESAKDEKVVANPTDKEKSEQSKTTDDSKKIESISSNGTVKLADDKKEAKSGDKDEDFEVKALEPDDKAKTDSTLPSFTKTEQEDIEKIVASYIEKHPEVLVKAIQSYGEQQQKEQLQKEAIKMSKFKDDLTDDKTAIVAGNPNGTVKLVIFADPNCPHCRHLETNLNEIKGLFSNLKIYLRPWPIMGKESADVVSGLTAAAKQGYNKFDSLALRIATSTEKMDKPKFMKISKELGLDIKKLQKEMDSEEVRKEIKSNHELAVKLGLDATPTVIMFDTDGAHIILPGDKDVLKKTLSEAKA